MNHTKISYERHNLEKEYEGIGQKYWNHMPPKMKLDFQKQQKKIVLRIQEITKFIKENPIEVIDTIHYIKPIKN